MGFIWYYCRIQIYGGSKKTKQKTVIYPEMLSKLIAPKATVNVLHLQLSFDDHKGSLCPSSLQEEVTKPYRFLKSHWWEAMFCLFMAFKHQNMFRLQWTGCHVISKIQKHAMPCLQGQTTPQFKTSSFGLFS